jgi:hypothetical protein
MKLFPDAQNAQNSIFIQQPFIIDPLNTKLNVNDEKAGLLKAQQSQNVLIDFSKPQFIVSCL